MPRELRDLTLTEQALIARVSSMVSYHYISETSVGYHKKNVANMVQRATRGGCFAVASRARNVRYS